MLCINHKNHKNIARKQHTYSLAVLLLAGIFLISGGMLAYGLAKDYQNRMGYRQLAMRFGEEEPSGKGSYIGPDRGDGRWERAESAGVLDFPDGESRRLVYQELHKENPDLVGWVRIDGTKIDYPVVQSRERPGYYLDHDFYGRESSFGTPYLAEECSLGTPGMGLLVCGHHMKNGEMFAALESYTDQEFFREHRTVRFDTLKAPGLYEVAAVIRLSASGDAIPWQKLLLPAEKAEREKAWKVFEEKRLYDTGIRLEPVDEVLCLVTCEYSVEDGRLMVVARKR